MSHVNFGNGIMEMHPKCLGVATRNYIRRNKNARIYPTVELRRRARRRNVQRAFYLSARIDRHSDDDKGHCWCTANDYNFTAPRHGGFRFWRFNERAFANHASTFYGNRVLGFYLSTNEISHLRSDLIPGNDHDAH